MFCSTMVNRLSSILVMGAMAFSACLIPVSSADACDVAAISGQKFNNGAPAIFKNRDESANWHQEIKNFPAVTVTWENPDPRYHYVSPAGAYTMVYNDNNHVAGTTTNDDTTNPSAGVNEAGFAIAVSSVYEDYTNPLNEIDNCNTLLIRAALQLSTDLASFETLLRKFHANTAEYFGIQNNYTISGNFVAMDAQGNAAIYEIYTGLSGSEPGLSSDGAPLKFRKIDANTGQITEREMEYRFVQKTFKWVLDSDELVTYEWSDIQTTELGELLTYTRSDLWPVTQRDANLYGKLKKTKEPALDPETGDHMTDPETGELLYVYTEPTVFPGYIHRTNNNSYIKHNGGVERNERMSEIFAALTATDAEGNYTSEIPLDYKSLIYEVAMNVEGIQNDNDNDYAHYSSTFCISRSATRSSVVVNGVTDAANAAQTTMWAALGEPSATVFMPFWAGTEVSPLVYVDGIDIYSTPENPIYYDWDDTCMINREANRREILGEYLYSSNGGSTIWGPDDYTINKYVLDAIQANTRPFQDSFFEEVDNTIGSANLEELSSTLVQELYNKYLADEI